MQVVTSLVVPRRFRIVLASSVAAVLIPLLVACGGDAATPEPEPTVPPPAPTRTLPPANPPATPGPGELTVGQIADKIAAAWTTVRTYRTEFTTIGQSQTASPVASPVVLPYVTTIDEFVLPDRRHRLQQSGATVVTEIIVIGQSIYVRGLSAPGVPAGTDPGAWSMIDLASLPADSPFRPFYSELLQPIDPPYRDLSAAERARIARPVESVTVDGRQCEAFRTVDLTLAGERVEVVISIDSTGLPCMIQTAVNGTLNITTFTFNVPVQITPPTT